MEGSKGEGVGGRHPPPDKGIRGRRERRYGLDTLLECDSQRGN